MASGAHLPDRIFLDNQSSYRGTVFYLPRTPAIHTAYTVERSHVCDMPTRSFRYILAVAFGALVEPRTRHLYGGHSSSPNLCFQSGCISFLAMLIPQLLFRWVGLLPLFT